MVNGLFYMKDGEEMPKQFKTARQINKLKALEAAEKLGVSQPTLSAWEGERKAPSIESLENMANLYGVTTDFLLGRSDSYMLDSKQPISPHSLPAFHGRPVWSAAYGWLLVNAADRQMVLPDGHIEMVKLFVTLTRKSFFGIMPAPFFQMESDNYWKNAGGHDYNRHTHNLWLHCSIPRPMKTDAYG